MPASRDPMQYRAGDDDRERVAEVLRQAAGDGRITLEELENRLASVYAGGTTYAQLNELTGDIPRAGETPALPDDSKPLKLVGVGGSVRRKDRWRVPRRIVIDRKHGSVRLDFRQAQFEPPVTEVSVKMVHGSVTLILPDGATAEVDCTTKHASVRSTVPEIQVPGRPHLIVTGHKEHGSLRIRYGFGHRWRHRRD